MPKSPLRSLILIDLVAIIIALAFGILTPSLSGDPGVGWHLKAGEWILANKSVPTHDIFLLNNESTPWICNQWLSDLILFATYKIGGWRLLSALAISICFTAYLIIMPRASLNEKVSGPTWLLGLSFLTLLGAIQWMIRPVIFSFLLFALTFNFIKRERTSAHDFILFPSMFLLWANLHPAFPLGLLLILFKAITEKDTRKHYLLILALSALITVINPFGLELHRSILGLVGSVYFMNLNVEWQSPEISNSFFAPFFGAAFLVLISKMLGSKLKALDLLLFIVFLLLALKSRRYIPFFAIASSSAILLSVQGLINAALSPFKSSSLKTSLTSSAQGAKGLGLLSLIGLFIVAIGYVLSSNDLTLESYRPRLIIDIIKRENPSGAVFHSPNLGGYITWTLSPGIKSWIDDRNEVNGVEKYKEYFTVTYAKENWQKVIKKYNFELLVLERTLPVVALLDKEPGVTEIFKDDTWVIFRASSVDSDHV